MADPKERFDSIVKRLRENNHKLTPQRLGIAKILAQSKDYPSIEQIYEQLQDSFSTMSLATVYRNVILLKSLGEVLELGFLDASNVYDGNKPDPHPHVICVQCKKIIDPVLVTLKDITAEIELAAFSPSNIVPGISWSPDKMLQARVFSYADAHRYRLGTHYEALSTLAEAAK